MEDPNRDVIMISERLTKTVKVTDPWCWYGKDTVDVDLHVINDARVGKTIIRIAVLSIDDFAVFYDYECENKYTDLIEGMYKHLKEYMYDRIPDEISLEWLYEHGYLPQ